MRSRMPAVATRRRNQPAPPWVVFEDLCEPDCKPDRPWLHLRPGEVAPAVVDCEWPDFVVWSSLWSERTDASIRFDLAEAAHDGGTELCWTFAPLPDTDSIKRMTQRIG